MMGKTLLLFVWFILLSGCGAIVKSLDSTWVDDQTVYNKSQPLPPLEISVELSET